ncbi:unnamed protein product [Owenia fusiformis]|uniref:Uncharacterized protein n=1 Tax=Owenia fusiformis TaxID=6347 RepID=A0A8J1XFR1_OWEFU|nr:unnamed protein product [Owenia fusiformis]
MRNNKMSSTFAGYLQIEIVENSGSFFRKYFILNGSENTLTYYDDVLKKLPEGAKPIETINLSYVSMVSRATQRMKEKYCFVITVAGKKVFLRANNEEDMNLWLDALLKASKLTVPKQDDSMKRQVSMIGSYRTEIAGGVVLKIPVEQESDGESTCDELEKNYEAPRSPDGKRLPVIKAGYCVKQGALVKNWKRRYFVLDLTGLSYFKNEQYYNSEKPPIKCIYKSEILDVRSSQGIHPQRDNLFEVVTAQRVYYVQCDTQEDMESWLYILRSTYLGDDVQNNHTQTTDSLGRKPSIQRPGSTTTNDRPVSDNTTNGSGTLTSQKSMWL